MDWDTPPTKLGKDKGSNKDKVDSLDSYKPLKSNLTSKGVVIILVILSLVLASAFIIRPALIGYSIVKQADETNVSISELGATVLDLRSELSSTKANLSLYSEVYNKIWSEVQNTAGELVNCQSQKGDLLLEIEEVRHQSETDLSSCQQQQAEATSQISQQLAGKDSAIVEAEKKLSVLQESFDEFAFNVARSVCCKAKVDNPNINSYEVSNSRLICLEDGAIALSC